MSTKTTTTAITAKGLTGYDLHLEIDADGDVRLRVRNARTGKVHANVTLDQLQAQFVAQWLTHDAKAVAR